MPWVRIVSTLSRLEACSAILTNIHHQLRPMRRWNRSQNVQSLEFLPDHGSVGTTFDSFGKRLYLSWQ